MNEDEKTYLNIGNYHLYSRNADLSRGQSTDEESLSLRVELRVLAHADKYQTQGYNSYHTKCRRNRFKLELQTTLWLLNRGWTLGRSWRTYRRRGFWKNHSRKKNLRNKTQIRIFSTRQAHRHSDHIQPIKLGEWKWLIWPWKTLFTSRFIDFKWEAFGHSFKGHDRSSYER